MRRLISQRPRDEFLPLEVFDLDIGAPLPSLAPSRRPDGQLYERGLALVRLHGQPLGVLELDFSSGRLTPEQLAEHAWGDLSECIVAHLRQDDMPDVPRLSPEGLGSYREPPCCLLRHEPLVSVVIATRGRPESLAFCLESFRNLSYSNYELIVVDNAPDGQDTAEVVGKASCALPNLRYVVEWTPGSSRARNRGLAESNGEIVVFTDDDVVVSREWLCGFVRGFECAGNVGCVTGLVLPAEFDTQPQLWFEQYGGFSRGYERRVFDLNSRPAETPIYPYNAGSFGAGASMAFSVRALRDLGGFDQSLGPGTPAKGGEDLDLFLRVILNGYRLVYEPSAVAWHHHRRDYRELRRQIHDYGVGLASLIMKLLLEPATVWGVVKRMPHGIAFLLRPSSPKNASKVPGYPKVLSFLELAGMIRGPFAYLRSRLQA